MDFCRIIIAITIVYSTSDRKIHIDKIKHHFSNINYD